MGLLYLHHPWPKAVYQCHERTSQSIISPMGEIERIWVNFWLSQLCGTLPKSFISLLTLPDYWVVSCMTGEQWVTERTTNRTLNRTYQREVNTTNWFADFIRKPIYKFLEMYHLKIPPTGPHTPAMLYVLYSQKLPLPGWLLMHASKGGKSKPLQMAIELLQKPTQLCGTAKKHAYLNITLGKTKWKLSVLDLT